MQFEEDDLIMNEKKLKLSDDMDSCMIDTLLEQKLSPRLPVEPQQWRYPNMFSIIC